MPDINWYPGHMARSRRLLEGQIKQADAIVELCDARAPCSTRNPDLIRMAANKTRLLVLNKADLADENLTARWLEHYRAQGVPAAKFNGNSPKTREVLSLIDEAVRPSVERMKARGVNKTVRLMVIGIPNVGKSTFINRLCGRNIAEAADRPGVTRASRWIKVGPYLELLDTPGLLWPKLENQQSARTLAFLGSIRDQIMDGEELAGELMTRLMAVAPEKTAARFKLAPGLEGAPASELMESACRGRGWLLTGGRLDTERAAALILDEFRAGKVGRVTLETPVR